MMQATSSCATHQPRSIKQLLSHRPMPSKFSNTMLPAHSCYNITNSNCHISPKQMRKSARAPSSFLLCSPNSTIRLPAR